METSYPRAVNAAIEQAELSITHYQKAIEDLRQKAAQRQGRADIVARCGVCGSLDVDHDYDPSGYSGKCLDCGSTYAALELDDYPVWVHPFDGPVVVVRADRVNAGDRLHLSNLRGDSWIATVEQTSRDRSSGEVRIGLVRGSFILRDPSALVTVTQKREG